MKSRSKYSVIDLFSGCGGLIEGFEVTGNYETIAAIDWDKASCLNLSNRMRDRWGYANAEDIVKHFDIQRTEELFSGWDGDDYFKGSMGLDLLVEKTGRIDLIIGGPPCQAYSVAGRIRDANGMRDDYRNYLFESYLKVVERYKPRIVVFENVQGICSAKPGGVPIIDRIKEAFNNAGYEIINDFARKTLIDFSLFGVPQNRKRVIILGLEKNYYGQDCQTLLNLFYDKMLPNFHVNKKATVRDAIYDLPPLYPSETDYFIRGKKYSHEPCETNTLNHSPRYHNRRDMEIFKELAEDIDSNRFKYQSIGAIKKLYTERTGNTSNIHKYYVLRWDDQSNTIPAHLLKDGLRHIHPDPKQARSITVREAARLQTFDDDYCFLSSQSDNFKMIGNAVPPLFARCLASAVEHILSCSFTDAVEGKKKFIGGQ